MLLLQRAERGDHNSGAWVFPGGIVDRGDAEVAAFCAALTDADASARLGVRDGGLAYFVAAVRESFEECGLLLARPPAGRTLDTGDRRRHDLHDRKITAADWCRSEGLQLAVDRLTCIGHWVTPVGMAKRFDTHFFVAEAPADQQAAPDGIEITALRWLRPRDALQDAGLRLITPTRATLEILARFGKVAALMDWAQGQQHWPVNLPRLASGTAGRRSVLPTELSYAEIGRLDPNGLGGARCEIEPERPVRLSPRIIRVTANNAGLMTGPGTNSYLVGGGGRNEWAVIDPGPADDAHIEALLAAAPGPIRWIFATHTHHDHSPGYVMLKHRTGATVHGRIAKHMHRQDATFVPDVHLVGGERLPLPGCDATLRVIHTPGHASNHLCYLLEEERTLFTGDHVMQSSTVVIDPPDGDMAAYIASLRDLLKSESLEWLAPGHGFLMAEPAQAFEALIAHRLRREAKVLAQLRGAGPIDMAGLLERVYDDVGGHLHRVALRSLLAHLDKLHKEKLAVEIDGQWSAAG